MCTKSPPSYTPPAAPKAEAPVAPLVSADEASLSASDSTTTQRKKGKDALKVTPSTGASSGLNIP